MASEGIDLATQTPQAHIADPTATAGAGTGADAGTPNAAEYLLLRNDVAANKTAIDAILVALETAGILNTA